MLMSIPPDMGGLVPQALSRSLRCLTSNRKDEMASLLPTDVKKEEGL